MPAEAAEAEKDQETPVETTDDDVPALPSDDDVPALPSDDEGPAQAPDEDDEDADLPPDGEKMAVDA